MNLKFAGMAAAVAGFGISVIANVISEKQQEETIERKVKEELDRREQNNED